MTPRTSDCEVVYADAHCIVAVKPSGLLSVPGRGPEGSDCLVARLRGEFPDALVVHRLDMATSGLMIFARGASVQRTLSIAFAQREIQKRYTAVVHGRLESMRGEINLPLIADWPNRPRQRVDKDYGKPSLTRYLVLANDNSSGTTRLELVPVTGRAHQLRVHLLSIGHPILGDALYAPAEVLAQSPRMLLHAASLCFVHPASGQPVRIDSPVPF
jgi:tRNA pseudouridine32 synthase / 23S rRNA pseudouridine746 synthase